MGENPSPLGEDFSPFVCIMPPYHSVSDVMKRVKGKTSHKLLSENRMLAKKFSGGHLWARGYFTASSGNVTDEVIAEYIQLQIKQERDRDDDFTIDGVESSSDDHV
jgi:REP-associated tyrosine transposase